jgi:hypothetical protein
MKFEKPINIRIIPNYVIKELVTVDEHLTYMESTENLGGVITGRDDNRDIQEEVIMRSGGRMEWALYTNPDYIQQTIPIQLMRIWASQLVTQMVNNRAYVNEISDEPKFDISDKEKEIFISVMKKLYEGLNDCLEESTKSIVVNKKIKKVEL